MTWGGERFKSFTTTAEQRWLTGVGDRPGRADERLPERAGLLIPRASAGGWRVDDVRTVRVWVGPAGQLKVRDRKAVVRTVAAPGAVQTCWWVAGEAQAATGLTPAEGGWLVLCGPAGPVLALRMPDWAPPLLEPDWAETLRASGAEGLAHALSCPLEAVADPAEAARDVGTVPASALLILDTPLNRPYGYAVLGTPLLLLALYGVLLALLPTAVTTGVTVALLALTPIYELVPLRARYLRTDGLPAKASSWWPAQPAGPAVRGAGLGIVSGVAGNELVVADGHGWEFWAPGPALGGMASLVVATDDAGRPWGLIIYDREQRAIEVLGAHDWIARPGSVDALSIATAGMGLVVSTAALPAQPLPNMPDIPNMPKMPRVRPRSRTDLPPGDASLGAMVFTAMLSWPFAAVALEYHLFLDSIAFAALAAALLLLRFLLRFRRVT